MAKVLGETNVTKAEYARAREHTTGVCEREACAIQLRALVLSAHSLMIQPPAGGGRSRIRRSWSHVLMKMAMNSNALI